jgi:hypothetical protein
MLQYITNAILSCFNANSVILTAHLTYIFSAIHFRFHIIKLIIALSTFKTFTTILAYFPFPRKKSRLMKSPYHLCECVCVCVCPHPHFSI